MPIRPCGCVGLYFWGLRKAKAGEIVIYADEADAVLGGVAAVTLLLTLILAFLVGKGYPRFFVAIATFDLYVLFWVVYRGTIYNPSDGRFLLLLY